MMLSESIRRSLIGVAMLLAAPAALGQEADAAYRYNWEWRCEEAGAAYSRLGVQSPDRTIDILLDTALNTSCRGEYLRADRQFEEARPRVESASDVFLSMKYGILHAQHLANKGDRAAALAEVDVVIAKLIEGDPSLQPAVQNGAIRIGSNAAAMFNAKRVSGAGSQSGLVNPEQRSLVYLAQAYWLKSELERGLGRPTREVRATVKKAAESLPRDTRLAPWLRGQIELTETEILRQDGDPQGAITNALAAIKMLNEEFPRSLPQAALYTSAAQASGELGQIDRGLDYARDAFDIRASLPEEKSQTWRRAQPLFDLLWDKMQQDSSAVLKKEFVNRSAELVEGATADVLEDLVLRLSVSNKDLGDALDTQRRLEIQIRRINAALERLRNAQRTASADYITLAAEADQLSEEYYAAVKRVRDLRETLNVPVKVFQPEDVRNEDATFASFQNAIAPGNVYVRFMIGDRKSYAAVVSGNGDPSIFQLSWTAGEQADCLGKEPLPEGPARQQRVLVTGPDILTCVNRLLDMEFTQAEEDAGYIKRDFADSVRPYRLLEANTLYRALFGQFAAQANGASRLVIEASGALNRLPFAALVIGAANGGDIREIPLNSMGYDYRAVRFLGIEKPLVFSASATTFVRLASTPRSTAERDFLGFGAYKPPADPAAIAARVAQDEACRKEYKDVYSAAFLSNSLPEVLEVRNTVGGDAHLAIGDDFSEKWMRANKDLLAAYKVLFFSTHGKMPARTTRNCISDPFMTTTVDVDADLTLSARNDLVADGLLQAVEIGGLVLNADLVVLSACETAGGTGEGGGRSDLSISALANMFFVAQARALISAQFSVPDETTRLLMIRLFERRKAGDNLSTALQQAQRSIWSGEVGCTERDTDRCILQGHPFFWSGFMLIGATGG